jgi:hypothetical protein
MRSRNIKFEYIQRDTPGPNSASWFQLKWRARRERRGNHCLCGGFADMEYLAYIIAPSVFFFSRPGAQPYFSIVVASHLGACVAGGRIQLLLGKSPFLTIQLLPQFSFGHRTSKPNIFDHPTLKTVHNWPSGGLAGGFNFFIYNLVLRTWNDYYFLLVAPI